MRFEIGDQVVMPGFGVGRIVDLVTKSFLQAESQLYYEVSGERSTMWAPVDGRTPNGLRPLTSQAELTGFRQVLSGQPVRLNPDFRQRQLDVREQLRGGTMLAFCEVVRDLTGQAWRKPLGENDANALRTTAEALCREWAAAANVPLSQATAEVNTLLLEARHAFGS
jgi:RNA polymerase-interacting CarD/CdnL/TRCF family regulator